MEKSNVATDAKRAGKKCFPIILTKPISINILSKRYE